MPQISIIVPVYKSERYLHECIDSILSQTFQDFELILVDDGSPDNCPAICDEYAAKDPRVIVIHKGNGGVSSARNAGLDIAKGEYITFVDSDDWLHPDFLHHGISLCRQQDMDIYCSGFARVFPDGTRHSSVIPHPISGHTDTLSQEELVDLLHCNYIAACMGKLIRRNLLAHTRFDTDMAWGEDLKLVFSLLEQHHTLHAEARSDYFYRVGHTSATASASLRKCRNIAQTYADLYAVIEKRGFGTGVYSRFLDWRCKEDLMYAEQLVFTGNAALIEKCRMLSALMELRKQLPCMDDSVLTRHLKRYGHFPLLLLLRGLLVKHR